MTNIYEPPWKDLEPRVRGLVFFLWKNGYKTTWSCQGGACHPERYPTVLLFVRSRKALKELELKVTKTFFDAGFRDLWISQRIDWRGDKRPANYTLVINFWYESDNEKLGNIFVKWLSENRPEVFREIGGELS